MNNVMITGVVPSFDNSCHFGNIEDENDIKIDYLDAWQDIDKIKVALTYTELRTGKKNTVQTEELFVNNDTSAY